jgi:hypothetical protein
MAWALPSLGDATSRLKSLPRNIPPINAENHAYHTWTHANGTCWPKDLLPQAIPNARILIFGYNSNVAFNVSTAGLRNHADALLQLLGAKKVRIPLYMFLVNWIFTA